MWGYDFQTLFLRGGEVMWPILVCSVIGLAVAIERMIVFFLNFSSFRRLVRNLNSAVKRGDMEFAQRIAAGCNGPVARGAQAYLENLELTSGAREEIVGRVVSENVARMEKRLHWLSIIGVLSPMLGLLGTVAGLVEAFNEIEIMGGQVQPKDLASGIWAALLTTVFGLVVALPALAVYHMLENHVNNILLQAQWMVSYLNQWLHNQPAGADKPNAETDTSADEKLTSVFGA